jgi:hypothetical protein
MRPGRYSVGALRNTQPRRHQPRRLSVSRHTPSNEHGAYCSIGKVCNSANRWAPAGGDVFHERVTRLIVVVLLEVSNWRPTSGPSSRNPRAFRFSGHQQQSMYFATRPSFGTPWGASWPFKRVQRSFYIYLLA